MGIFKGTEKILAVADHPFYAAIRGVDRFDRWVSHRPLYLCHFLKGTPRNVGINPGYFCFLP
jgi:hypothetical protein